MSDTDATNPGTVSVADEAYGRGLPANVVASNAVRLPVTTSPYNRDGAGGLGFNGRVLINQAIKVSSPGPAIGSTNGGSFQPGSARIANVTANNVADQVFGSGSPQNVYV